MDVFLWQEELVESDALQFFTDSSGSCGYGAYFNGLWSIGKWPTAWRDLGLTKDSA